MKKYTNWFVELHPSQIALDVHDHILHHVPQRLTLGNAVIVCEQPERYHPAFAKRWKKVASLLEKAYASTLDTTMRRELKNKLELVSKTRFVSGKSIPGYPIIWLHSPDQLTLPPNCMTLYVAASVTNEQLDAFIQQMPQQSAIIVYSGGRSSAMPQRQT